MQSSIRFSRIIAQTPKTPKDMRTKITVKENFAFLLAGLLLLFLLLPFLRMFPTSGDESRWVRFWLMTGFSALMVVGVWSLHRERQIFRLGAALAALSAAVSVGAIFHENRAMLLFGYLLVLIFCSISGYIAARHVFGGRTVDRNILFGAVCVYLLLGLIWAVFYALIIEFWPSSFNGMEPLGETVPFDNLLYFSFVTLASLGYGDITPVAPLARTLAYLEVVIGQFYIAILVAGLVGLFMGQRKGS